MSRRGILRVYRPRTIRSRRAQSRLDRLTRHREQKRAIKHATMRDCGRRCVYCASPLALATATLDHVHPVARGGSHALGNLVAACERCNRLKGDMLPAEFFARFPWAGLNFMRYARAVHRALKRGAKRAVSLAYAA
jgi:5-methylcytosine-specific restriction endonuclease McrA